MYIRVCVDAKINGRFDNTVCYFVHDNMSVNFLLNIMYSHYADV